MPVARSNGAEAREVAEAYLAHNLTDERPRPISQIVLEEREMECP